MTWGNYKYIAGIAGFIIVLDQATKSIVRASLAMEEVWVPWPWLEPYARIVHWKNEGASFGFLGESNSLIILISLVVIGAIIYYFPKISKSDWSMRLALALLMGGVTGNLIDRLIQGHVTDFLSIISYNVFNFADVANFAGVIVLLFGIVHEEWEKHKARGKTSGNT
jgi:signal peptidase II